MRRVTRDRINKRTKEIDRFVSDLPRKMKDQFQSVTPIRSGNARSKTKLEGNEIQANYPYANRLNEGWSKQADQGMTDPTIEWVRQELRKLD